VRGYDINPKVGEYIKTKQIPYLEVGAPELLQKTKIEFLPVEDVLLKSDIVFVPIQTPHDPQYEGITRMPPTPKDFDYTYLKNAIIEISKILDRHNMDKIIIIISTVLPGTIESQIKPLMSKHIKLCYNPFFIAMGNTIDDFLYPEFVLFGVDDGYAYKIAQDFYKTITDKPFYSCSLAEAECIKVFYNTFISTKVVFGNIVGEICYKIAQKYNVKCDSKNVIDALALGRRRIISTSYMYPGMPDAGGCHPRDNQALSFLAKELNLHYDMFRDISQAREHQCEWFANLIQRHKNNLPIRIMGKSYKPETNLTVGSGSLLLQNILKELDLEFNAYDPYLDSGLVLQQMLTGPGCYFIATKHPHFQKLEYPRGSIIIDPFSYIPKNDNYKVIRIG
jgi:UDPglucose 6-dehydrogenase